MKTSMLFLCIILNVSLEKKYLIETYDDKDDSSSEKYQRDRSDYQTGGENGGCTFCNCHVMAKDGTCLLEKRQPKFPDDISKELLQDILLKLEERD